MILTNFRLRQEVHHLDPWEVFPGDIILCYEGHKLRILSIVGFPSLHSAPSISFSFQ